jgi:hypothetical protein
MEGNRTMQWLTTVWNWFSSLDYFGWLILLSVVGTVYRKVIRPFLPEKATRVLDHVVNAVSSDDDETDRTKEQAKEILSQLSTKIGYAANDCEACPSMRGMLFNVQEARNFQTNATKAFQDDEDWNEAYKWAKHGLFHATLAVEMAAEYRKQVTLLGPATTDHGDTWVLLTVGAEDNYSPGYAKVTSEDDQSLYAEWRKLGLLVARCQAVLTLFVERKELSFTDAGTYLDVCEKSMKDAVQNADDEDWDALGNTIADGLFFARLALKSTEAFLKPYDVSYTLAKAKWDTSEDSRDDCGEAEESMEQMAVSHAVLNQVRRAETKAASALFHLEAADKHWKDAQDKYLSLEFDDANLEAQLCTFHAELAREVQSAFDSECHRLGDNMPSTAGDEVKAANGDWLTLSDDDASSAVDGWRELSIKFAKLEALIARCGGTFEEGAGMTKMAREYQENIQSSSNSDWSDVPDVVEKAMSFADTAIAVCQKFRAKQAAGASEAAQAAAEAPATLQ